MIIGNKEDFFAQFAPKHEDVEVNPGKFVRLVELGATEFVKLWTNPAMQAEGKENALDLRKLTPALIVAGAVDENGARIFDDADAVDLENKTGASIFLQLGQVARRLNGMVGDEAKNSEASQEKDSSSGSPSN